ncbi:MAG: hypothetical protein EAX96_19335 [Candidatus Lokiarchaeota archaeon]|nr:hypothetical protein [Candidatus Lokiarchaeota archaeon]
MDHVGDLMSLHAITKTIEVIRNRFIFEDRVRISEFVDMFTDNLYKVLPKRWVKPVHEFLDHLVDELMWI